MNCFLYVMERIMIDVILSAPFSSSLLYHIYIYIQFTLLHLITFFYLAFTNTHCSIKQNASSIIYFNCNIYCRFVLILISNIFRLYIYIYICFFVLVSYAQEPVVVAAVVEPLSTTTATTTTAGTTVSNAAPATTSKVFIKAKTN